MSETAPIGRDRGEEPMANGSAVELRNSHSSRSSGDVNQSTQLRVFRKRKRKMANSRLAFAGGGIIHDTSLLFNKSSSCSLNETRNRKLEQQSGKSGEKMTHSDRSRRSMKSAATTTYLKLTASYKVIIISIIIIKLVNEVTTTAQLSDAHLSSSFRWNEKQAANKADSFNRSTIASSDRGIRSKRFARPEIPEPQQQQTVDESTTRLVAVVGQWIELQCPLLSYYNSAATGQEPQHPPQQPQIGQNHDRRQVVVWRRNGSALSQLANPRYKISPSNGSLIIVGAQAKVDEGYFECSMAQSHGSGQPEVATGQRNPQEEDPPPLAKQQQQPPQRKTGSQQHLFELRLVLAPKLAPFEGPQDAQVGMKLVLTCSALEGQQPISFIWLKDGQIVWESHFGGNLLTGSPLAKHQQQQQRLHSLGQLHGQQLADKFALMQAQGSAATSGGAQTGEPLIMDQAPDVIDTSSSKLPMAFLSDPNIRVRQSDDYSILSIERLELKHSGRYTCSAQNEAARTSHSTRLLIKAPPTLTLEPRDTDLVSGQSSVLDCAASGQPRPTISWLRARESTQRQWDYVPVFDGTRYLSLANGSLAIANVTQRESGYYLCAAKNGFGPEVTKLIKITVHEPAKFSSKYKTVEVRVEERASLICAASGELPIAFEWLDKDGNLIKANDKRFIIEHEQQDAPPTSASKGQAEDQVQAAATNNSSSISRLMITRSGRQDSGHYTCQASNKHGADKMAINLLVQDVPDKVSDLKVTNVTSTTISLRWHLAFSGNSPTGSYLVQYQSDDPLDDLLLTSVSGATTTTQQPLATRVESNSSSSGQQRRTDEDPTSKTAAGGATVAPAAGGGTGSGGGLAQTLQSALSAAASLESAVDEAIDRTLVELTVEQSATSLVIKDLTPHCLYRIRLAAINRIGLGEFSDWIRAKTEEAAPSGSATKISASATGPNSIKLTWSPPERRSWNGQLIGFNLGYRPLDSTYELNKTVEWQPPPISQALHSALVLEAAAAADRHRTGSSKQQATPTSSPEEPTGTGRSSGDSSGGDDRSGYLLRQHLRQLLAGSSAADRNQQQEQLVAHLTNLQRSTTYLVWVQAVNQRGFGPQSHAVSVRTLDDVPPSAPALRVQAASASSITVAWSMLSNFVSPANQYSLFYRRISVPAPPLQLAAATGNRSDLSLMSLAATGSAAEQGPFIERTLSSQQVMAPGSHFLLLQHGDEDHHLLNPGEGSPFGPGSSSSDRGQPTSGANGQSSNYRQFAYTLDQLECGSVYELYMTTRNSVGKSEPSALVTTRTMGEPPAPPANKSQLFARISATEVALNLAAWSTGGCPISHLSARYKQIPFSSGSHQNSSSSQLQQNSWPMTTSASPSVLAAINGQLMQQNLHQQQKGSMPILLQPEVASGSSAIHLLKNLLPAACYELEITAQNSAGPTSALYEFVTSNLNGSRAGFSRREPANRLLLATSAADGQSLGPPLPQDGGPHRIEQQATSFGQQAAGAGSQLLPAILLLLCFVCLAISSAFCYHRLTESWKSRRSSDSMVNGDGGSDHGHGPAACRSMRSGQLGGKPSSAGGGGNMWNQSAGQLQETAARFSARGGHHHLGLSPDHSPLHYCSGNRVDSAAAAADQQQPQLPVGFSQSVSMKDFNLALGNQSARGPGHLNSATLNYRAHRNSQDRSKMAPAGGTLRAATRLMGGGGGQQQSDGLTTMTSRFNGQANGMDLYGGQTGSGSGPDSLRLKAQDEQQEVRGLLYAPIGGRNDDQLQCQYNSTTAEQEVNSQATSWPTEETNNYSGPHYGTVLKQQQLATAYAVPSASQVNYGLEQAAASYEPEQGGVNCYGQAAASDAYGQSSIDACIQQLMSQQYQQQQQYAMVINQKAIGSGEQQATGKCLYGNSNRDQRQSATGQFIGQQTASSLLHHQTAQSIIDSSSSSSGIDVGLHLDCASTATGTASNNSNASNCNGAAASYLMGYPANSSGQNLQQTSDSFSNGQLMDQQGTMRDGTSLCQQQQQSSMTQPSNNNLYHLDATNSNHHQVNEIDLKQI